jgi:hypothetical protein
MMSRVTAWLHQTLWLAYAALAAMGVGFLFLLLDRGAPFRIEPAAPVAVRAGQWAFIDVPVWRDSRRQCSATFSRYLFDADSARFDVSGPQQASAATIQRLARTTPGRLVIKILIPPGKDEDHPHGISPGPAQLVSSLSYVCNRAQRFWPLELETEIPLVVVP